MKRLPVVITENLQCLSIIFRLIRSMENCNLGSFMPPFETKNSWPTVNLCELHTQKKQWIDHNITSSALLACVKPGFSASINYKLFSQIHLLGHNFIVRIVSQMKVKAHIAVYYLFHSHMISCDSSRFFPCKSTFLPYPYPKLIFRLSTQEGRTAELVLMNILLKNVIEWR